MDNIMTVVITILYILDIFLIGTLGGTVISALKGRCNPQFASLGFILIVGVIPSWLGYFMSGYLIKKLGETIPFTLMLASFVVGFLVGLKNKG